MEFDAFAAQFDEDRSRREKAIFGLLFTLANRLQTAFEEDIPRLRLKPFLLLSALRHYGGPATYTEAGQLLGCSRQNIKNLAKALEGEGMVRIAPDPEDGRALLIHVTDEAEAYFRGAFSPYERRLCRLFGALDDEEVAILFRLLLKVNGGVEALRRIG